MRVRTLALVASLSCVAALGCALDSASEAGVASTALVTEPGTEPATEPAPAQAQEARPEAAPEPEPEPPPPPPEPAPFAAQESVTVEQLLAAIVDELPAIAASPAVRRDYEAFLAAFELADDDELYLDYVRVKVAFEATRAGGLWGVEWDITNEQPNSDLVWARWHALELGPAPATVDQLAPLPRVTATAECDQLSALFAFVAQRIGLSRSSEVGLLWPVSNHTVAVWTIDAKGEQPTRVVIPTSQVFLDGEQSLGTREFNAWRQKTIFDYRRQDAAKQLELPGALASAFVLAIREHGPRSQAQLQAMRNAKESGHE